jgi:hypothetical protein
MKNRLRDLSIRVFCPLRGHPTGTITVHLDKLMVRAEGCACGKKFASTRYHGQYPRPRG